MNDKTFLMLNLLYKSRGKKTDREFYKMCKEMQTDISYWLSVHFPKIYEAEMLELQCDVEYQDTDDLYTFVP